MDEKTALDLLSSDFLASAAHQEPPPLESQPQKVKHKSISRLFPPEKHPLIVSCVVKYNLQDRYNNY